MVAHAPTIAGSPSRTSIAAIPAPVALGALVLVSAAVRWSVALAHSTPRLLPDEYIYASLARSLAHGSLTIRGAHPGFPALLEPLLAAPFGRLEAVELAYRLTLGLHAVVASLAAVPAYLLARRLGATKAWALACALLALTLPSLLYVSYVTADAVALPLALGAVVAGARALERPTARSQAAFLALAGLASFARLQYVVVPAAFVVAAVVVAGGRPRRVLREFQVTVLLLGIPLGALAVAGPGRLLGYYRGVTTLGLDVGALAHWAAADALLLIYASGVVLVPGALFGLALTVLRPRNRAELGLGVFTATLSLLLLFEAALYASNGSARFQERYLMLLPALVPPFFLSAARRLDARPARFAIAAAGALVLVLASLVPVSTYAVDAAKQDSPTLQAVYELGQITGVGNGSLLVGLAAGGLGLIAAAAALAPRRGTAICFLAAAAALTLLSWGAIRFDLQVSADAQRRFLGANPHWVDDAGLSQVAVLQTPYSSRTQIAEQLFWNASLVELLRMRDASEVDSFGSTTVRIDPRGHIVTGAAPLRRNLLVQESASVAELEGARLVGRAANSSLWQATGTPRLKLLLAGRYADGWLAASSTLTLWPAPTGVRTGTLRLRLSMPAGAGTTVELRGPGLERTVSVRPGQTRVIEIPVAVLRPWKLSVVAARPLIAADGRPVSVQSARPTFDETPPTP